jgi:hypothetical protein
MRTIKFRAKKSIHSWEKPEEAIWLYGDLEHPIMNGVETTCIFSEQGSVPVEPTTVGQFTGITAIDGAEIYEGDTIREIEGKRTFVVEYSDDYAAFIGYNEFDWIILHKGAQYRVIGDIYDRDETETI